MLKYSRFICCLMAFILLFALIGCDKNDTSSTTGDISSTVSDISSDNTSSDVSVDASIESSSSVISSAVSSASVSSTVNTLDKNHPYYDVIKAIEGIDRTRYGFSFGLSVDSNNRPTNAMSIQNKYKKYGLICMTDEPMSIHLTFNTEYETVWTPNVLDTLKEKGCKAVFFISQNYAENNPKIVQRMIDEGHVLASHGARHKDMALCSPEEVCDEIMNLHNYVKDRFGYEMKYFRPPSGVYSEALFAQAQLLGYTNVEWSFAYDDWDTQKVFDEQAIYNYITTKTHEGAIYSFHTTASITPKILGRVIDYWQANGYTVTAL